MKDFKHCSVIFFDLDGTLTDSKLGIIRCLQYSLGKFGICEASEEKLTRCIGPSLSYTYREWYGLSEVQARQATEFYRERFERLGIRENELYAGIAALLGSLRRAGKTLVLATAKPTVHAERILRNHGIAPYFSEVAGSNLDGTREDKGEVIAFALQLCGGAKRDGIVMVGDRAHDVRGAREHGIAVIAAGYGYGDAAELAEARPDAIADSVTALRRLLL